MNCVNKIKALLLLITLASSALSAMDSFDSSEEEKGHLEPQFIKSNSLFNCLGTQSDGQKCTYSTKVSSNFTKHWRRIHSGYKPYACGYEDCPYATACTSDLKKHRATHGLDKPEKKYFCSYDNCNYGASRKHLLEIHIDHEHINKKSTVCEVCGKECHKPNVLANHLKSHKDILTLKRARDLALEEGPPSSKKRPRLHYIEQEKVLAAKYPRVSIETFGRTASNKLATSQFIEPNKMQITARGSKKLKSIESEGSLSDSELDPELIIEDSDMEITDRIYIERENNSHSRKRPITAFIKTKETPRLKRLRLIESFDSEHKEEYPQSSKRDVNDYLEIAKDKKSESSSFEIVESEDEEMGNNLVELNPLMLWCLSPQHEDVDFNSDFAINYSTVEEMEYVGEMQSDKEVPVTPLEEDFPVIAVEDILVTSTEEVTAGINLAVPRSTLIPPPVFIVPFAPVYPPQSNFFMGPTNYPMNLFSNQIVNHAVSQRIETEKNTKPKCEICQKYFSKQGRLDSHNLELHTLGSYACKKKRCTREFQTKYELKTHNCVTYDCKFCDQTFDTARELSTHHETHSDKFKCAICANNFSNQTILDSHNLTQHTVGNFVCKKKKCAKQFDTNYDLKAHRCVPSDLPESYNCKFCSQILDTVKEFLDHSKAHAAPDRPYKCSHCEKRFKQPEHRRQHEFRHTGDKPFSCGNCGSTFVLKSHLQAHFRDSISCKKC